jgi:hypothetical protein
MSSYHRSRKMKTSAIFKPVVISQASGKRIWASGLVVMTSRLQRGDRLFNSGLAHSIFFTSTILQQNKALNHLQRKPLNDRENYQENMKV